MTEKLKTNKGETNVKDDGTLLYSPNMIDFSSAEVVRGKQGDWDDLQLYGTSNISESEYQNTSDDAEADQELMERIRSRSIGRKIRMLDLEVA